jgi:threonine/homoserine/homoserine lactone efflux protein
MTGAARLREGDRRPQAGWTTAAMETVLFFFKGVAAGFVIAAPVGPVGVMCVRRTLSRGLIAGYATGLGAALADTLYGIIAAFGVTFVALFLLDNEFGFRLVGGIVLCVMAVHTFLTSPVQREVAASENLVADFATAFVVTGTNPITLVAFGVVFTAIGVVAAGETLEWAQALIAGVFVGSALWWTFLTGVAGVYRGAVGHRGLRWINMVSAMVILVSGVIVLIGALMPESLVARLFNLPFA